MFKKFVLALSVVVGISASAETLKEALLTEAHVMELKMTKCVIDNERLLDEVPSDDSDHGFVESAISSANSDLENIIEYARVLRAATNSEVKEARGAFMELAVSIEATVKICVARYQFRVAVRQLKKALETDDSSSSTTSALRQRITHSVNLQ